MSSGQLNTLSANLIEKSIQKTLEREIDVIYTKVISINDICLVKANQVSSAENVFTSTFNINSYIIDFYNNTANFVLDFNKRYNDNSNILSGLVELFETITITKTNSLILNALGIKNWEEVKTLKKIPNSFIDWTKKQLLDSLVDRITNEFSYPEFYIGTDLAYLLFYSSTLKLKTRLLPNLKEQVNTLLYMNSNQTGIQTTIYELLDEIYLDINGDINYSKLTKLNSTDKSNVKKVVKGTITILNNSLIAISKTNDMGLKSFELSD